MTFLSFYFLAKTALYYSHYSGFLWGWNVLLALLGFWPTQDARWLRLRRWLVWPLALALAYHESFLPTPERIASQLHGLAGFSASYLWELVQRAVPLRLVLAALGLALLYRLAARWLRFSTLAWLAILSVPVLSWLGSSGPLGTPSAAVAAAGVQVGAAGGPDAQLQAFYASEAKRHLSFPPVPKQNAFDLIFLHVCSMSWDDLDYVGARDNPLFKRFDIVFHNFNGAATYSGPATYRLFRGNCGQTSHTKLYDPNDIQCDTFPSLTQAGYQTRGMLNHNGIFDSFIRIVEHEAGLQGRMEDNRSAPEQMKSFDGTPVYDDYWLLSHWWAQRLTQGPAPTALYYNTISLHDGNRLPGVASRSSLDTYKPRVTKLLSDFDRFTTQLEASGRPVVLVLVPEHGAGLRGDKMQISGMREIPNPNITLLPAAIKFIGLKAPVPGAPIAVDQPMSYFGLNSLLANVMADSPYGPNAEPWGQRLENLQTTPFVAENDDVIVMRDASGRFIMRSTDKTWLPYNAN